MWSPQLIAEYVLGQFTKMLEGKGMLKESVEKSLRKYDTRVHPLFKERLEAYGVLRNDGDSLTTTTSYSYYKTDQGFAGNRLMNYIFQSMFDQEEPEWGGNVIYVSASTKTIEDARSEGDVMDRAIKAKVASLTGLDGSPASFRNIAADLLGHETVCDLLDNDLRSSSLGRSIDDFIGKYHCTFPNSRYVEIATRKVTDDLTMTTKYYPGRDDFRAYCRDTNWLRHLCGICLHKLLLPADMKMRERLEREEVIPAKDKDLLDLRLPYPRANEVALLILGDVSNFTGSLGNSWIMLYCMALQLSQGGTWTKRPNLYSVGGSLFTATWYELIVVYLYLNVGYPAFIQELNSYEFLPGGFLGVAANITIGLLFLSVTLQNLKLILSRWCRVVKAQAGGDDFALAIIVQREDRVEATELIREHFVNYVGPLKDFVVVDLMTHQPGRLEKLTFCKKWIQLEFGSTAIQLKGFDNPPIIKALLPASRLSEGEALEQWYSYDKNLETWESVYGQPQQCDTMRKLFAFTYPNVQPLQRRQVITRLPLNYEVLACERRFITKRAYNVACRVEDVTVGDLTYLSSLSEKASHCLKSNRLTLRKVERHGVAVDLILCKSEVRYLHRSESFSYVGLDDDVQLTNKLLTLITN